MQSNQKSSITIGLPFYNASLYLESALISILNQEFKDWLIVLVDDGSTDSSLDIAYKYQNLDSRITVVSDGLNKGLPSRLNQIARLCTTKYLARMDADDLMHPLKLKKQYEILVADNNIDVLGTNAFSIDEINNVVGVRSEKTSGLSVTKSFIHPTIIGKTSWFLNNPYDENAIRIEDAELWYRTEKVSVFKMINEPLFFYREFSGSYYKKYYKVLPSLLYLIKKYNFDNFWIKKFILALICVPIYYFFECIIKSDYMILRRNSILLKSKVKVVDVIGKNYE